MKVFGLVARSVELKVAERVVKMVGLKAMKMDISMVDSRVVMKERGRVV